MAKLASIDLAITPMTLSASVSTSFPSAFRGTVSQSVATLNDDDEERNGTMERKSDPGGSNRIGTRSFRFANSEFLYRSQLAISACVLIES